jgi:hypothetical protein
MKEMHRLTSLLFPAENGGAVVRDLKFFPGEQLVTVEEFCREVHAGFVQVDSKQAVTTDGFDEELTPVDIDVFLAPA